MPTRVKVCGITRREDAELAVELGAAALGFNFYPRSPRYVTPASARAIIWSLAPFIMPVGVFADETDAVRVAAIAKEAGVAAVQLHGPPYPIPAPGTSPLDEYYAICAIAVTDGFRAEQISTLRANAYLLDGFDPNLRGGTGKVFDWEVARRAKKFGPIILAGGLTPENVAVVIRQVRPYAVDVASGVECAAGLKDPAKLRAFFAAVKEADQLVELITR